MGGVGRGVNKREEEINAAGRDQRKTEKVEVDKIGPRARGVRHHGQDKRRKHTRTPRRTKKNIGTEVFPVNPNKTSKNTHTKKKSENAPRPTSLSLSLCPHGRGSETFPSLLRCK